MDSKVQEALVASEDGAYLVGSFLGVKAQSTWAPPDAMRDAAGVPIPVKVPPKLGLEVAGRQVAVVLQDEADAASLVPAGAEKGDRIAVPVRVFPGRNGNSVRYVARLPGGESAGGWR